MQVIIIASSGTAISRSASNIEHQNLQLFNINRYQTRNKRLIILCVNPIKVRKSETKLERERIDLLVTMIIGSLEDLRQHIKC